MTETLQILPEDKEIQRDPEPFDFEKAEDAISRIEEDLKQGITHFRWEVCKVLSDLLRDAIERLRA